MAPEVSVDLPMAFLTVETEAGGGHRQLTSDSERWGARESSLPVMSFGSRVGPEIPVGPGRPGLCK